MALKLCVVQFLHGFRDSIFGFVKFFQKQKLIEASIKKQQMQLQQRQQMTRSTSMANSHISLKAKSNEKLYQRLIQSCILNGIFLLACIIAFNYVLMPILNWIAYKLISDRYHNLIIDYINPVIQLLFSFVWILPVFLLSKVFNLLVHQEIADCAYYQKYGKPQLYQNFTLAQVLADNVFSGIMGLIFLVQSSLMNLVPIYWLNLVLCHVHLSFLYSLYAFEYKLCNMSWDIKRRISYIESRWPYYFGFGLSLSLILSFAGSHIYNATLFASIFPAFILSAIEADSEHLSPVIYYKYDATCEDGVRPVLIKLPLFRLSLYLTDILFKFFTKKQNSKLTNSTNTNNNNNTNKFNQGFTIRKTN